MKTHAYVDGHNLYNGIMDPHNNAPGVTTVPALRQYLWLDLDAFVGSFFVGNCSLERVHYFTAPIRDDQNALKRQEAYLKALESIPHLSIHRGFHAKIYDSFGKFKRYEEKQTDVKFGLQALEDALKIPDIQRMVFVCADQDQVPTIKKVQYHRSDIEIRLIFPPMRRSGALEKLIPNPLKTNYRPLRDSQFPDPVTYMRDGKLISVAKPSEWA